MPRNDRRGRSRGKSPARPAGRQLSVRVKSAKGRKASSTRWLQRQLNDPYVTSAGDHGYRSRAAWKLIQLDDKFELLARGRRIVDLGAAPGGWTQVAVERVGAAPPARVVAIDTAEMEPVAGAEAMQLDFLDADGRAALEDALADRVDVVLSDLAAPATGHRGTDQLRATMLSEMAHELAGEVLAPGGALVLKVFHGGGEADLMTALKRDFARVRTYKPAASRPESGETYVVATGYRGGATAEGA
jgi:23S rRNA (uridine2552-2'-O)-methyltransferase